MITLHDFRKISDYEWEIPRGFRKQMRVPVRIFATRKILENALGDLSMEQALNASALPGVEGSVVVMPDVHQGYGFPIGGVAATRYPEGVISPGAIGYDINCGVRLLASTIPYEAAEPYLDQLAGALDQNCPSGVGNKGTMSLSDSELDQVCRSGARWALKKGMVTEQDLRRIEEGGMINGADPHLVSARAKE
ncbi:MAG TPA: RtcB family protein, partial [Anaerolineaceae bacterium]